MFFLLFFSTILSNKEKVFSVKITPLPKGKCLKNCNLQYGFIEQFKEFHKIKADKKEKVCSLILRDPCKQLQFEVYKKRVLEHLNVSMRSEINKSSKTIKELLKHFYSLPVRYYLEIDGSGNIKNFFLTSSSGVDVIDQFVNEAVRRVAPFPNIPAHLNVSSYVVQDW